MIACLKTCLHLSHRNCIVMEISFSYIFFCQWVVHALLSYMYVSPLNFSKLLCIKHTRYKHINDPHALQVTTNKNHKFKSNVLQLTYPHLNAVRLEWFDMPLSHILNAWFSFSFYFCLLRCVGFILFLGKISSSMVIMWRKAIEVHFAFIVLMTGLFK